MLHPGRVERRAPASVVVLRTLQIEALAVHPHGDVTDARPRVEPRSERPQRPVIRRHRTAREPDRRTEELTALVEHALLDDLVRPQQERLRNCEADGPCGLQVDHQIKLGWLFDWNISRLGAL